MVSISAAAMATPNTPPMQTMAMLASSWLECTPTRTSSTVPIIRPANEATHMSRYPMRNTTGAPTADPITTNIIGVSTRPASVADDFSTTCTKSGRNEMIANITMPSGRLITLDARVGPGGIRWR